MTIREAADIVPEVEKMRVEVAADAEEGARAKGRAGYSDGYAEAERDIVRLLIYRADKHGLVDMDRAAECSDCVRSIKAGAHRPKGKSDG